MSRDEVYLLDMLIAARKARGYAAGMSWEEFGKSEVHQEAVVRMLEIVGEAARRVSESMRATLPSVPWRQVIGMRNFLVHEYFRIDRRTVWETLERDVPDLIRVLERVVPPSAE